MKASRRRGLFHFVPTRVDTDILEMNDHGIRTPLSQLPKEDLTWYQFKPSVSRYLGIAHRGPSGQGRGHDLSSHRFFDSLELETIKGIECYVQTSVTLITVVMLS